MTHEVTVATANAVQNGWIVTTIAIAKVVISVVVTWIGGSVGQLFMKKTEIASLEAAGKKGELEEIAHTRLSRLAMDAINFIEESMIRPKKKEDANFKMDEKYRKEVDTALVAFVRNMADKYHVDNIVSNFSDENIVSFVQAILNVVRKRGISA